MLTHFQVATFDIFASQKPVQSWNLAALQDWGLLLGYGRPAWKAMFEQGAKRERNPFDYQGLINLAQSKLLGGRSLGFLQWPPPLEANLVRTIEIALLSRRGLVRIGKRSELAKSLVASCMAVCLDVSEDLESLFVESLSEPILSEAAALLILRYQLWPTLLRALVAAIQHGTVESGRLGELATWILFAIAWDAACIIKDGGRTNAKAFTRSDITLRDFLTALLGELPDVEVRASKKRKRGDSSTESEGEVQSKFVEELLGMHLCFTHVLQLSKRQPSRETLELIGRRMALGVCVPGTDAIDGLAALWSSGGDLGSMQVQIKNQSKYRTSFEKACFADMSEVADNMAEEGNCLCGLDLVIHVGDKREGRAVSNFFIMEGAKRACLLLSTDSKLSLFGHAIQTATQTPDKQDSKIAAESVHGLFQKFIDAERLVSFKDKGLSIRNPPQDKSLLAERQPQLSGQTQGLMDVFILEKNS
jgi:hypothetical protein